MPLSGIFQDLVHGCGVVLLDRVLKLQYLEADVAVTELDRNYVSNFELNAGLGFLAVDGNSSEGADVVGDRSPLYNAGDL